jgi:hypothetical protein
MYLSKMVDRDFETCEVIGFGTSELAFQAILRLLANEKEGYATSWVSDNELGSKLPVYVREARLAHVVTKSILERPEKEWKGTWWKEYVAPFLVKGTPS